MILQSNADATLASELQDGDVSNVCMNQTNHKGYYRISGCDLSFSLQLKHYGQAGKS